MDQLFNLNIGALNSLVYGALNIDYSTTTPTILNSNLGLLVAGTYVPVTGLTITQPTTGNYVITGTAAGTPVQLAYTTMAPSTTNVRVAAAGQPVANISENVLAVAACFAAGTLIATHEGEVPVEQLAVGNLVVTAGGALRPIKWLGHRSVDCRAYQDPTVAWPIRVAAHTFAPNKPAEDLWLSPGHSVCVDMYGEMLVPIERLVNGATIAQVPVETVSYWHVELDTHDVILANGLPAESFIDIGNRVYLREAAPEGARAPATIADYCRPFLSDDLLIRALRSRLRTRALTLGWRVDVTPDPGLRLRVDGAELRPEIDGHTARFVLPASAQEVWLQSATFVPFDFGDAPDTRVLGAQLRGLSIAGRTAPCRIALAERLLCVGFYGVERNADGASFRWTNGHARLPADLWRGRRGDMTLLVEFSTASLVAWVAPADVTLSTAPQVRPYLRLVKSA